MKRILFVFFIFVSCSLSLAWALDASYAKTLKAANQLYAQSKYELALNKYQKLVLIEATPEAYYNLGNAYFKTKKLGEAIAAYEKAKMLAPRDSDIRKNLKFASSLIQSKIIDKQDWFFRELEQGLSFVSLVECEIIALVIVGLTLTWMILLLAFGRNPFRGWIFKSFIMILVIAGVASGIKYYFVHKTAFGIVIRPDAEVRFGPSRDEKVVFRLPEGLKVRFLEEREGWERVQLTSKDTGWIPKDDVEIISVS